MFDLVQTVPGECGDSDICEVQTCHVEMLSQLDRTEVIWEQTTCDRH